MSYSSLVLQQLDKPTLEPMEVARALVHVKIELASKNVAESHCEDILEFVSKCSSTKLSTKLKISLLS